MTLTALLNVALDLAFLAVFVFTLADYLRHREPVRRAVVLMFGALVIVLGVPVVTGLVPAAAGLAVVVVPALLIQPALVLWLVSYVRPIPRPALILTALAFVGLTTAFFVLFALRPVTGSPAVTLLAIALVAYFALLEGAGAIGFALAARRRAGASRSRLAIAAAATGMLGLALVILLGRGLAASPGSEAYVAADVAARVIALVSALGYLIAFAPPRWLRRVSQQSIVYDMVRELSALPAGTPTDRIWQLLERVARNASGATRAEVVTTSAARAPAAGLQRTAVPLRTQRWPSGRLELDLPPRALFLDDDLDLITLLVDRAARAAEREEFLVERERLIADLQAASAAKSDFLAAMSHELRTPLNAIIGFSELLAEGDDDASDVKTVMNYAEHIHGSGLHLLELVNDVLDLARVEAGRLDLKPITFELDSLVRQTVASIQPLADQKHLSVTLQLAPVAIEADPSRVRQIVLNLLSNAVKFTDEGGQIRLSLDVGEDGGARFTVADTGRGIRAEDFERIFEAFQQSETEATPSHHEGTGLGLALSRQLAEAHGGRIEVRSAVGAGSEFTIHLPAGGPAASVSEHAPALLEGLPKVLVIEDDPAARELLRVHLEGAGYAVLATGSGRQGLAWLAEVRPDAVLLDILLPDLDGWEILQRAKSDPQTRSIPIMVVSVVDDRKLGLALGAVDYVVKPVSRERLLEALGRLTFTTKVRTRTVTALVIDSDPKALERYRDLLEPDGFAVIGAQDGAVGLLRATADRPDLILLDALLPDMDGFEVASRLRQEPATATIPIWFTTPAALAPDAKARLNGNVQGVVTRGDHALAALRGWLETGRPSAPTPAPAPERSA